MTQVTAHAATLRALLAAHTSDVDEVLSRYGASNARLFGSVARGDAQSTSDIDLLVDLQPERGNALLQVAGIGEELSRILGVRVDVVSDLVLREPVSESARRESVAL